MCGSRACFLTAHECLCTSVFQSFPLVCVCAERLSVFVCALEHKTVILNVSYKRASRLL